jgi:phosphatidylglycerophosphatase A
LTKAHDYALKPMNSRSIAYICATFFGIGYTPLAPGTAGSLMALLLIWFLPINDPLWLLICCIGFAIGLWSATRVEQDKGKDPGIVVIDEVVGQWCAVLFIPRMISIYIAAFLLFRIFDIIKPYPAGRSQNLTGGIGIMIDDIIAALYVNIILQIIVYAWI